MIGWFWQTLYCTSDIYTGAYSPFLDEIVFRQWYEDGWSLFVVRLTTLTSELILGHISPIFFEYPWDWDSGQFGLRLSTSPELPTIDCIKASLHGFVEIEMDRIRFHPRSVGGSFSQMFMRQICFRHCYLVDWIIQMSSILCTLRFAFRWATIYTLWDSSTEQFFSDTEASFSLDFSEVCHDASVTDTLILANDWFIGCFSTASTLDTGAYFLS